MGTWSFPNTEETFEKFEKFMSKKVTLKDKDKIYDILGDDSLFDVLDNLESDMVSNKEDIRIHIFYRFEELMSMGKECFVNMPDNVWNKLENYLKDNEKKFKEEFFKEKKPSNKKFKP